MKMKDKTVVKGNGLAGLAARHKGAARARVQKHAGSKAPGRSGGKKR